MLLLVGAGGASYEEAAEIAGCALGTVKSRLARGRTALAAIINGPGELDEAEWKASGAGKGMLSSAA
jgi:RNA polymerase sigma-70 factor, ECF subfamily